MLIVDIGIGGSVGKKKKKFNWAKYEKGRDDEIRKVSGVLKVCDLAIERTL